MLGRLFLLFSLVTLVELSILMPLGAWMGWGWTLVLVFGTGFLGAYLAKQEGLRVMLRVQKEMAEGKMPTDAMLDGLLILIAGILLMTPGILTDFVGFSMLLPITRIPMRKGLIRYFKDLQKAGRVQVMGSSPFGGGFGFGGFSAQGPDIDVTPDRGATRPPKATPVGQLIDLTSGGPFRDGDVIDITPEP